MADAANRFSGSRPAIGPGRNATGLFVFSVLLLAAGLLGLSLRPVLAAKVETRTFSAYYTSQSAKIYDHLLKVTDYYASLVKDGNAERVKDVLALRASLAACWEMVLNAGDMVYIYDLLDPGCSADVNKVGALIKTGLGTVAGKLDKELQWMRLVEKNVSDLPVSVELGQAFRDIEAMAAYFRTAAATFEPPAGGETRQPVKQGGP
ncbi:MAG: hypothetical protein ACLGQH_04445 [Acidobacteriota bacterium]